MYNILWRRGTADEWLEKNTILRSGEPGLETDTGKYKVGDGVSSWLELPYFIDESRVLTLVQGWATSSNNAESLSTHIESETPHPVYDDGPSLFLLYQNAKV